MQCATCPEGYVCSVERLVSFWEVAGVMGVILVGVLVAVCAIVGLLNLLEG